MNHVTILKGGFRVQVFWNQIQSPSNCRLVIKVVPPSTYYITYACTWKEDEVRLRRILQAGIEER